MSSEHPPAGVAVDPVWHLEPALEGDLAAIMEIERSEFGSDAWSDSAMAADLASEHTRYLVAVSSQSPERLIWGYAGMLAPSGGSDGDIQTIAVSPDARRQGIGRGLMLGVHSIAGELGVREIFLEVREDNPHARALYESLDYEEIGVRPGYYQPDNVDAIVMRVSLAPQNPKGIGR